jgi:hypothetical protein
MLFRTLVLDPVLPVMAGSLYGPQVPLAALVTHDAPEPPLGGALADEVLGLGAGLVGPGELGPDELGLDELGLDELGLDELGSDELGLDELGVGQLGVGELGLGQLGLGEAELEDSEGDGDGSAEVVLVLGNGFDDCESLPVTRTREGTPPAGAALPNIGPQPVRTTMVVDTAIAGHISLVFTRQAPYLLEGQRKAATALTWAKYEMSPLVVPLRMHFLRYLEQITGNIRESDTNPDYEQVTGNTD